ncbi:hypothetical protein F4805DRAFT_409561 [Annulohypoxylon moriforme]|nr:hypothetical protein F4805DRAFT_409561 [Annulohypoxylon moriforme]
MSRRTPRGTKRGRTDPRSDDVGSSASTPTPGRLTKRTKITPEHIARLTLVDPTEGKKRTALGAIIGAPIPDDLLNYDELTRRTYCTYRASPIGTYANNILNSNSTGGAKSYNGKRDKNLNGEVQNEPCLRCALLFAQGFVDVACQPVTRTSGGYAERCLHGYADNMRTYPIPNAAQILDYLSQPAYNDLYPNDAARRTGSETRAAAIRDAWTTLVEQYTLWRRAPTPQRGMNYRNVGDQFQDIVNRNLTPWALELPVPNLDLRVFSGYINAEGMYISRLSPKYSTDLSASGAKVRWDISLEREANGDDYLNPDDNSSEAASIHISDDGDDADGVQESQMAEIRDRLSTIEMEMTIGFESGDKMHTELVDRLDDINITLEALRTINDSLNAIRRDLDV